MSAQASHRSDAISVVIPTYNGARFVGEALESVFAQTRLPQEIIVVDDCSRDDTLAVVKHCVAKAPVSVRVIALSMNSGGPAKPINVGIQSARGEWIAVLDQDDLYSPDLFKRVGEALQAAIDCLVVLYWAGDATGLEVEPLQPADQRKRLVSAAEVVDDQLQVPGRRLIAELATEGNFALGFPGFVFRRAAWSEKGGVDERLKVAADMELLGWLFQRSSAVLLPHIGYRRREHDGNVSHNRTRSSLEVSLVRGRLVADGALEDDAAMAARVIANIRLNAYWFRQAHKFREARELYRLLGALGDGRLSTIKSLAKLHLFHVLTKLTRHQPEHTYFTHRCTSRAVREATS